jgi:hypothetical protein
MPASNEATDERVEQWERAVGAIERPVTDEESVVLMNALPNAEDDCYGLAFTLQHACETAPGYGPELVAKSTVSGHWRETLLLRLENAERLKRFGHL